MTESERPDREAVEQLLLTLPRQEAIRPENGEVSFSTAWEIRAFALAVAAHQNGQYDWEAFQHQLAAAINRWEESGGATPWRYYDRWLEALESLLTEQHLVTAAELDQRTHTVLGTPRDAEHQRAHRDPVAVDTGEG
jgi:nitrile hydratase accessory protein